MNPEVLSQVNLLNELTSKSEALEAADKTSEYGEYTYTYHGLKRTWVNAERVC